MTSVVRIFDTPDELFDAAAALFVRTARGAVDAAGSFAVALAGGSTPMRLYARLAAPDGPAAGAPWARTHFFWGDERHVPPDHPESNYGMAFEAMLRHLPVASPQVHRIKGELPDADAAAADYEQELRRCFTLASGRWPRLDLVLLGLGADGHTASLFPGTPALDEHARLAVATTVPNVGAARITLTAPVLNGAARVVFLVEGTGKADAVAAVLQGPQEPDRWPAQLIQPKDGELVWLLDAAAAGKLSHPML